MPSFVVLLLAPLLLVGAKERAYTPRGYPLQHELIDFPVETHPELERMVSPKAFDARLIDLWLMALERPDMNTRLRALEAMLGAHRQGMPGVADKAGAAILRTLSAADQYPMVQVAAARAVIDLQMRDAAAELLMSAKNGAGGPDLILKVDPALSAWGHGDAIDWWFARLTDEQTPEGLRISAIDALARTGGEAAITPLLRLAMDRQTQPPLRLAAAEALGLLASAGLEEHAAKLLVQGTVLDRLTAVSMIQGHDSSQARRLFDQLIGDPEAAVVTRAIGRLFAIDPQLLLPHVAALAVSADVNHRRMAAEVYYWQHIPSAVMPLAQLLADRNNDLRNHVRRRLLELGQDAALDPALRSAATHMLHDEPWQGLEQAAIILGRIDEKSAESRLAELIVHPRAEVRLAAIVALRWIKAAASLPVMLARGKEIDAYLHGGSVDAHQVWDLSSEQFHLFQTFGTMGYEPAVPLMRKYIPKSAPGGTHTRVAAIWAIGQILENRPDSAIGNALASRLSDVGGMFPEDENVRRMSAITMGLMNQVDQVPVIQQFYEIQEETPDIRVATRWAVMRLTGTTLPEVTVGPSNVTGWFLEPLDP